MSDLYGLFLDDQYLQDMAVLLKNAGYIGIISHQRPDPDTLGSGAALYEALTTLGKKCILLCKDAPAKKYTELLFHTPYHSSPSLPLCDLFIIVDASCIEQTGYEQELTERKVPVIAIDHHHSHCMPATTSLVDTKACSTTALLYCLFLWYNIPITPTIATYLLLGIYWDTGSFKHTNTLSHAYIIASKLLKKGADQEKIVRTLYQNIPLSTLKLWGCILQNFTQSAKGITYAVVEQELFTQCNARPEEVVGCIDYLNSVPGSMLTLLLTEERKNLVKGSMRTQRTDVDLSKLAHVFGGGGHKEAAGFALNGGLDKEYSWSIVQENSVPVL